MYMCEGGVSVLLLAYWPDGLVTDTHTHTHTHRDREGERSAEKKMGRLRNRQCTVLWLFCCTVC